MAVRRVRQHEHRFDSSEVSVDDGHRRFVGDVDLGANPLDNRVRADLLAIVHEKSDAPAGHGDAIRDAGVGELEQADRNPFEARLRELRRVIADQERKR